MPPKMGCPASYTVAKSSVVSQEATQAQVRKHCSKTPSMDTAKERHGRARRRVVVKQAIAIVLKKASTCKTHKAITKGKCEKS